MRWLKLLTVALFLTFCGSGCAAFCRVEQWKCDNFGCCGFGTQPSYYQYQTVP